MDWIIEEFHSFIALKKEETQKMVEALVADDRADEAKFLKAKANIYDVFGTLFDVSVKQAKDDVVECRELFLKKAEMVPQNWKKSLEAAKAHDDVEKIMMEETKLSTAEEIVEKFEELVSA